MTTTQLIIVGAILLGALLIVCGTFVFRAFLRRFDKISNNVLNDFEDNHARQMRDFDDFGDR